MEDIFGEKPQEKPSLFQKFKEKWKAFFTTTEVDDLNPTPQNQRKWNVKHYTMLWIAMVINIPSYMIGAGLFALGLNWWKALIILILGNALLCVPINLNGHAGAKYGIPFPVFIRQMFGYYGSKFISLARGTVLIFWFSVQTWIGGQSIYFMCVSINEAVAEAPFIPWLDINVVELSCFLFFWIANVLVVYNGSGWIKKTEVIVAPFLSVITLTLFIWSWISVGSFLDILDETDRLASAADIPFHQSFLGGTTAVVGLWSTLSLNMTDYTRFASSQRSHILGQILGFPIASIILGFIGIFVTGASSLLYGRPIWNPLELVVEWDSAPLSVFALIGILLATFSTNVAANIVSPSNSIVNIAPNKISYKVAVLIVCSIGLFLFPWKALENPDNFILKFVLGASTLMGSVAGVMICDYWIVNYKKQLDIEALYNPKHTPVKWEGLVAFAIGFIPVIPGILHKFFELNIHSEFLESLYDVAFFVCSAVSFWSYFIICKAIECKRARDKVERADDSFDLVWDQELKVMKPKNTKYYS